MKKNTLSVDSLFAYYNSTTMPPVISNLSFEVPDGGKLGVLGPSGIGKTTLLKAIACDRSPNLIVYGTMAYHDEIYFDTTGVRTTSLPRTFYVPQITYSSVSPVHKMSLIFRDLCKAFGKRWEDEKKQLARSLNQLELTNEVLKCYSYQLSGGMLQRILIAFALTLMPDIILLDEPTSALDPQSQEVVIKALQTHEHNCIMIIVSHDEPFIQQLCSQTIILE